MTEKNDLQFERAQFDSAAAQPGCLVCSTPLFGSYFEVNGHTVCERCCYRLREGILSGSRAGRVLRVTAAGTGAALAGAILYWAILAATGYEFGLIAIVVGFAVGKAVRWGSHARGGWAYQTLAMGLTYMSIVSAYVPMIVTEVMNQKPRVAQTETARPDGLTLPDGSNAIPTTMDGAATEAKPEPGTMLLALGGLLLIAFAAPFLAGIQNVIGIVIIGVGMYEAWKLNRRVPLVITGPHALASSGAKSIGL